MLETVHPDLPPGLWPVVLTPFMRDKSIDWDTLDRLIDWYLAHGAAGLFACCTSSETLFLTEPERLAVAKRVVARAGRTPVVAAGIPGREPATAARFMTSLAEAGVRAAVLTVYQLADQPDSVARWISNAEAVLAAAPPLALGLYEAPWRHHKLLTPEQLQWAVGTRRFVFLKDTTCSLETIRKRIPVVQDSALRLFNANAPIFAAAMRAGADGFCGIAANAWPGLCGWLARHALETSPRVDEVQAFIRDYEPLLARKYPASAKALAAMAGVPIQTVCRRRDYVLSAEEMRALEAARNAADRLLASLGMPVAGLFGHSVRRA